ncbi:MAG: LamG domain-containing protein [Anaerolineae bacterium]|nr:LamG domain-containing protein [Anaerolineae bacterium]
MPVLSVGHMARRLTTPFARGADTLPLTLVTQGSPTQALIAAYDFLEHRARFGPPPAPRYILTAWRDLSVDTQVTIDYTAEPNGPPQPPLTLTLPAGTLAGASLVLDLGAHEGPEARLTKVTMSPPAVDEDVAGWWGLTALLGNIAKLLWVLGWERDHIRRQMARTTAQRRLSQALGLSLDLIGYDLGIPRFPPLPYSFEADTIALYHLNDQAGANPAVKDMMGDYPNRPGHHGALAGSVLVGAPGRFGRGFAFQAANAVVEIPSHSDFDLGLNQSFTAECFVQPNRNAADGHLLSKHPDPATDQAGWALSLGDFGRGLPLNPRWLVSDGLNPPLVLFADAAIPADGFTHLAAVIDRPAGVARLYVNGQPVAQAALGDLQAITNAEPVRIGYPGAALQGVVEEVRLSKVARSAFHPVLGESDDSYRRRLRFFRRWVLPTPANLEAMLNEAIGPVKDDPAPLIVNETNTDIVGGAKTLTIDPVALLPGECIDAAGNRRVKEVDVCGSAVEETLFDPVFLVTHNDPQVTYLAPDPRDLNRNELPPDPHRVQLVVERALNRLLDLAAPEAGAGQLTLQSGFDPRAPDLRATGRGLRFSHTTIAAGRLAALAHRAGFTFVCYQGQGDWVYASCTMGEYIEIVTSPAADFTGLDGLVGDPLTVTVRPALPQDTVYRWLTIACGEGRATFSGSRTAAGATVQLNAPGDLTVKIDVTRRRNTVSATRTLRIGLKDLANNNTIGRDGALAVSEAVAGEPDRFFHPAFLVNHNDARADYGADPNHHLMQAPAAARLTRLLDLLSAGGLGGQLQVVSAFAPGATDLTGMGRGLTLRHPTLTPGQLASLAFAAGFTFVRRQDPDVLVRQAEADLVVIDGADRLDEGRQISLAVQVKPGDVGAGVRLQWTLGLADQAQARLSSVTQPSVDLLGRQAGRVRVQAFYLIGDNPAPYTFEVRLKPALEAANAIIRKEQYDLVMNILNAFHPIGVEVITQALRKHVVELQGSALEANPDYTYPKYRVRGPAPRQ